MREQEVENLTRAYATLKDAQSRLMSCRNTVTDMGSTHSGESPGDGTLL